MKDGTLILSSPLGDATLYIDADIPTEDTFTSEITLAPSDLSYGGYEAQGAGFVTLDRKDAKLRIIGQMQAATLSNTKLDVTDADLQLDGTLDLESLSYLGAVSLDGGSLSSALFASDPARLAWDGSVSPHDPFQASGTWIVSAENARTSRPARAVEIAETLSLFPALSVVPVTEHFAPQIREVVRELLIGSDVSGQGRLTYGPDGFTVNPVGPFNVKSSQNQLLLRPRSDQDFYVFDQETKLITVQLDAVFIQPVGLTLNDIQLQAGSDNGVGLKGVEKFSTNLTTQSDWHANGGSDESTLGNSNGPVRLGPLKASLRYDATAMPRNLSVNTALDYDGPLPGGVVEALELDGRLDVLLYEGRQVLGFTPRPGSDVSLKSLETSTDWQGEDINFTLAPARSLFTRTAEKSTLAAILESADFTLTRPAAGDTPAQQLDIKSSTMNLSGELFPNATQNWTVDFTDVGLVSETLPGPGTSASAAQANLIARLVPDQPPQITLNSPSITAETPLVRLSNIEVGLRGTPDAYVVDHKGGTITGIGSEFAATAKAAGLASFPANGTVEFENGGFSGQAVLSIAKANNAQVSVDYTFQDGAGTAQFDIPSILFAPKGLQPQTLVPAFRGKVAQVDGEARAKINIAFADGALTSSDGTVQLIDMDIGTAPGPITDLNTTMRFASLWPLETDGQQTLTMKNFNPGFPLEDGVLKFSFVPDGVQIDAADWPIGNGYFSMDPFTWVYAGEENRVTMRIRDVALGDFVNDFGNKKVEATGNIIGVFPVIIRGVEVLIDNGTLSVPDGGLIKYDPGPNVPVYTEEEALAVLREKRVNEYSFLAQDALREFRYRELSASMNGPINGDVEIGLVFDGANKKVLNSQPFRFNISVKGELINIARSFDSNAQVKSEILRQNGVLPTGTVISP